MQTKLEKRLSRLTDPTMPQDLQDRCFETIPIPSATQNASFRKTARPFTLQRLVVPSAFLFVAVVGGAFLSTRPSRDGKTMNSGSVAFAQVLEATQQVTFFHIKGRLAASQDGKKTVKTSDAYLSESWYDENQGFYTEQVQELLLASGGNSDLPKGTSVYARNLLLPNGTAYMRASQTATVYAIPAKNLGLWKQYKNFLVSQLTGDVEGKTDFAHRKNGNILSVTAGKWKGQQVQILVFERQPSQFKTEHQGAHPIQAHFYVNPRTNLVIAEQDFIVSPETNPALIAEYEFDYTKPDPALFDPKNLTKGATIRHALEQAATPSESKSHTGS